MKFKVDENLPEELVDFLDGAGWDSSSVYRQDLSGAEDPEVARICNAEDRILVTFDRGFANVHDYPPTAGPGIIVFRLKKQDKENVLRVSMSLIQLLRQRELRGELWIVQEKRIRIRTRCP